MIKLLEKKINFDHPPRILTIFGEEEFLVDECLRTIIKKINENENAKYEFERYDGEEISLNDLADIAGTVSFLTNMKTVLVKNFEKLVPRASKKSFDTTPFGKYLKNPSPSTFLILQANHSSLNGLSKQSESKMSSSKKSLNFPFDVLIKNYAWLEFPKVWPNEFPKWIDNRAKSLGMKINPDAIEILISRAGDSLRSLSNELEKLSIYNKGKDIITLDNVIEVTGSSKESNVFDLQKAVGARKLKQSMDMTIELLAFDRQEMLIISILQKFFVSLLKLSEMDLSGNRYAIAGKLGVNSYFLDDYINSLKRYPVERIVLAISALMEADEQIKSSGSDNLFIMLNTIRKIIQ